MESIRELYRIGYGPSSSHTMGPSNAASIFKEKFPNANKYEITLYNSLYLTGAGHMTNEAILNVLENCEVVFKYKIDEEKHPNTMNFKLYEKDNLLIDEFVSSVGGGKIVFENILKDNDYLIYDMHTFDLIKEYCLSNNITLYDYVLEKEGLEINLFLADIWEVMKQSVVNGLSKTGVLPGDLGVKRKANYLINKRI